MARTTIGDVARAAGVSTATVSRVLTGSAPVTIALRARVEAAAEELDYTVNTMARALRRDRTSTIGMVVPDLSNPFFTMLVDGVERGVQRLGLSLHLCSSLNDPVLEARRVRSLQQARVEALVVTPVHVQQSGSILREVADAVPLLQLDQFADDVESDWVGVDEQRGMHLVFEHLAEEGVRSAAYVGGRITDSSARNRYEAACQEAAEWGIELETEERFLGDFSVSWGADAASRIAARGLPEAIVCAADVIALGVLQGFDALGIRVPDDVLVTGFDDIPLTSHPRLSITTVRQPVEEIASRVVEALADILDNKAAHVPERVAVEPDLVVRSSTSRAVPPDRSSTDQLVAENSSSRGDTS